MSTAHLPPALPTDAFDPAALVHRVLALATGWIVDLGDLLPTTDEEARQVWGAPSVGAVEDKVVAEVATFAHVAARTDDPGVDELFAAMSRRARPARHLDLMRLAPHVAWPLGIGHTVLQAHGVPDAAYDGLLARCLASGWNSAVDRPRFREMEMRWARSISEGLPPQVEDLWPAEGWGKLPAFLARRADHYALTHAIFYATDFGAWCPPTALPLTWIAAVLDAHLADRLWEDDLDLVAELALAAVCVRAPSRYLTAALAILSRATSDGLLPAAGFRTPLGSGRVADFAGCYHSTLVIGLLAAALLDSPAPVFEGATDPSAVSDAALDVLLAVGDVDNLDATWVTLVEHVRADPADLISLILDGALARVCRRGSPALVESLLTRRWPRGSLTVQQARTWQLTAR
jgi:hypothetical protein